MTRVNPVLSRLLLVVLVVASFSLAIACGHSGASPEDVAAGEKVFLSTCATCHGKDARGLPKLGKNLHANEFVQSKSDEELIEFVEHGRAADDPLNTTHVAMPPKGGNPALTHEDIEHVVAFVRSLQQ